MDHAVIGAQPERFGTLVVVFLRGGADALQMVVPVQDDGYYIARPQTGVPTNETLDLDGFFALHPALAPLREPYSDGRLLAIHGAGSEDDTRSHFEAQDLMEHGGLAAGGWLGRYLRELPRPAGPLSAVALGKTAPESLRGAPAVVVLETLDAFSFGDRSDTLRDQLARLYGAEPDYLGLAGRDTLRALEQVETLRGQPYRPARGAEYPDGPFGRSLQQAARLIKARVGVEAACLDLDGWDTHLATGTLMEPLMRQLGAGLAAFCRDLGPDLDRTTVVVMSEFGRRVRENASFGTDHGRGGIMFVLGGDVRGGRVLARWKGLDDGNLIGPGDLPVTCNYRNVLAPLLRRHGGLEDLSRVFPDFPLDPVDF